MPLLNPGAASKRDSNSPVIMPKFSELSELEATDYNWKVKPLFEAISDSEWEAAIESVTTDPYQAQKWDDKSRFLPIHSACACQAPASLISALIKAYPDGVSCVDDQGMLPLHYACGNQASREVIRFLLVAYPEATKIPDPDGMLPLHYLAYWGPSSVSIIDMVLLTNAEVSHAEDDEGKTALDLALEAEYPRCEAVVSALRRWFERPSTPQSRESASPLEVDAQHTDVSNTKEGNSIVDLVLEGDYSNSEALSSACRRWLEDQSVKSSPASRPRDVDQAREEAPPLALDSTPRSSVDIMSKATSTRHTPTFQVEATAKTSVESPRTVGLDPEISKFLSERKSGDVELKEEVAVKSRSYRKGQIESLKSQYEQKTKEILDSNESLAEELKRTKMELEAIKLEHQRELMDARLVNQKTQRENQKQLESAKKELEETKLDLEEKVASLGRAKLESDAIKLEHQRQLMDTKLVHQKQMEEKQRECQLQVEAVNKEMEKTRLFLEEKDLALGRTKLELEAAALKHQEQLMQARRTYQKEMEKNQRECQTQMEAVNKEMEETKLYLAEKETELARSWDVFRHFVMTNDNPTA